MSDDAFFIERKAAAVLKHGVLSRYVRIFAMKTGSTSANARVVILDGYAGAGRYEDGSPGSPVFMAATARGMSALRNVELFFVEQKKDRYSQLLDVLNAEADGVTWTARWGSVHDHLDEVLETAQGVPFFAFIDPCGLGISFDDIVQKIFGRPSGRFVPGTEVLLNFSADAVRRIGGRLKEPEGAPGREKTLAALDAVCGGDWWRELYLAAASPEEATHAIASGYLQRLAKATGAGGWLVDVKNAEHHQPRYFLVFLTRHSEGLSVFGDQLSMAQADWRRATVVPGTLLDDSETLRRAEAGLEAEWVKEIKENIARLLSHVPSFTVRSRYIEVLGKTGGYAREKHIRQAIKELHQEGVTAFNGVTPQGQKLLDQLVVRA